MWSIYSECMDACETECFSVFLCPCVSVVFNWLPLVSIPVFFVCTDESSLFGEAVFFFTLQDHTSFVPMFFMQ